MNLTELLLVTVMGFHGGRIGQMTLVEMGEEEFATKRYALRKFMGGLHAAYLHPAP